jgi:hypothetical protein
MQAADENKNDKEFIFDRYWSPTSSSSIIISSRALLNEAEDFVFCTKHAQYGIWGRIATTLVNHTCNRFLIVANHEINGHGFRARSQGVLVSHYSFTLGLGVTLRLGGATHFKFSPARKFASIQLDEWLLITMGGCEANNVLARELLFKNFKNLSLDSRSYSLFFHAYSDLPEYILDTFFSKKEQKKPSNDIASYIKDINRKYNADGIDMTKLAQGALVFLLNPIYYVALWANLDYLFTGKDSFTIPHLKLGSINYMPLVRMGLTPFGPTYYLENYIGYGNKTFLVRIDSGHSPCHTRRYGGVQLRTDGLWIYKNYGLDVTGNLWYQPKLQLKEQDQYGDKNYWGGLIGINTKFKLGKLVSLNTSILYKNTGFVEGIVANSGLIFRAGFSLHY